MKYIVEKTKYEVKVHIVVNGGTESVVTFDEMSDAQDFVIKCMVHMGHIGE